MLLQVPIEIYGDGGRVRAHVQNLDTEKKELCGVVWSGGEDLPGLFKVGLEILGEARLFGGELYEARSIFATRTPCMSCGAG